MTYPQGSTTTQNLPGLIPELAYARAGHHRLTGGLLPIADKIGCGHKPLQGDTMKKLTAAVAALILAFGITVAGTLPAEAKANGVHAFVGAANGV